MAGNFLCNISLEKIEAVAQRCSTKKIFLETSQNSQQNTCARVCRPKACNFIKEETLAQVFSCEFCKIFKSNFFIEHLGWLSSKKIGKIMEIIF